MRHPVPLLVLLLVGALRAEEPGFTATLDGAPAPLRHAFPLLEGRPLRAGDVVQVEGVRLALGADERRLDLVREQGRLISRRGDVSGPLRACLAPADGKGPVGLASLTPAARRLVREVVVDAHGEADLALLAGLDLARCVLIVEDGGLVEAPLEGVAEAAGRRRSFPQLPPQTRHLAIRLTMYRGDDVFDLSGLGRLTDLETLDLGLRQVGSAPLALLARLRVLSLSWSDELHDLTPLAGLSALEALALAGLPVSDLAPLARVEALQRLELSGTRVRSLEPLADLPALRWSAPPPRPWNSWGRRASPRCASWTSCRPPSPTRRWWPSGRRIRAVGSSTGGWIASAPRRRAWTACACAPAGPATPTRRGSGPCAS